MASSLDVDDSVRLHPADNNLDDMKATSRPSLASAADMKTDNVRDTSPPHLEQQQQPAKIPFPSCRLVMSVMAFLGFFNAYSQRVDLSVALVDMVNSTVLRLEQQRLVNSSGEVDGQCPGELSDSQRGQHGEFNWNTHVQGNILAAFFYGYIVTQVLGGWLADRVGGKWFFGGGILVTSVLSLLVPTAARNHFNALIAMRVLQGFGEGAMIPSMHALYATWTPPAERARTVTTIFSGTEIGTIVGMLLSGVLCDKYGWPSVFYVFGVIGIVWSMAWLALCHNSPAEHPRISAAERTSIEAEIGSETSKMPTPWLKILTSLPVWATTTVHFAHNWSYYTLLTCLPRYMHDILHYNIKDNGLLSSLPYVAAFIVMLSGGHLADWLRAPNRLSTTTVRKIFCTAGVLLPGIFLIISGFVGCNRPLIVALIIIAVGCSGLTISGYSVNLLDLAAGHAGTLMGLTNSMASVASMIAPQVVGAIIYEESTRSKWQVIFYITFGIYCFGAAIFLLFGSGEQQDWAKTPGSNDEQINSTAHGYMTLEEDVGEVPMQSHLPPTQQ